MHISRICKDFAEDESGQDLIEYALIAGLIGLVAVATLQTLATSLTGLLGRIQAKLDAIT
ncbi:Flp family type IVb pilin [Terriglobus sp. RCC_193]|uniref:Flp family type IVb pilin n=1 Tax=Terriglobus sp. RCC_193 TaxID=3239218 RepID=UPI0035253C39